MQKLNNKFVFGLVCIYSSYAQRTGRLLSAWEALRPMWPFVTYFVLLLVWPFLSPNDIMERDPRAMFMLSGTIFSNVSVSFLSFLISAYYWESATHIWP